MVLDEQVDPDDVVCSAKGCRDGAAWVLEWRNPRIHGEERRKTWVACAAHRESLSSFLALRSFLLDVTELPS